LARGERGYTPVVQAPSPEAEAHLLYQRTTLTVHRFDATSGAINYWQGMVDEVAWPEGQGQVGCRTELEGGARRNVYLDAVSIARAKKLGKGNISEGIRIALSRV
jgi:hypothetical protein